MISHSLAGGERRDELERDLASRSGRLDRDADGARVDADAGRLAEHVVERHQREAEREAARDHQQQLPRQVSDGVGGGAVPSCIVQCGAALARRTG